jgi:TolB-like protein
MLSAAPEIVQGTPVVVASISDVQNLDTSSPFGNIVADFVRSRLVQKGILVPDMRKRSAVLLRRHEGELMLSRNLRALAAPPGAAAVATGTYAVSDAKIYVTLKIISEADSRILSAADFVIPTNGDNDGLLSRYGPRT